MIVGYLYAEIDHTRDAVKTKAFVAIFAFAALYGFWEYSWLQYSGSTGPRIIFQFSEYHIYMLIGFAFVCFIATNSVKQLPLMLLVQDVFYHLADDSWPKPGGWQDWPLGGIDFGIYIPGGYFVLFFLMIVFYNFKTIHNTLFKWRF